MLNSPAHCPPTAAAHRDRRSLAECALVEFVGTFFLIYVVGICMSDGQEELLPILVWALLTALIFMGSHVSGSHYNPAVTLALWLQGGWRPRRSQGSRPFLFTPPQPPPLTPLPICCFFWC